MHSIYATCVLHKRFIMKTNFDFLGDIFVSRDFFITTSIFLIFTKGKGKQYPAPDKESFTQIVSKYLLNTNLFFKEKELT